MASITRLLCAERGHAWEDASYFQETADRRLGLKYVWVLRMKCERDDCDRVRIDRVMPKTFKLITRTYSGEYEKIGRVTREELRRELIDRAGVRL